MSGGAQTHLGAAQTHFGLCYAQFRVWDYNGHIAKDLHHMGTKCLWASSISLLKKRRIRARADKEKKKQAVVTSLDIKVGEYILPFYAIFKLSNIKGVLYNFVMFSQVANYP